MRIPIRGIRNPCRRKYWLLFPHRVVLRCDKGQGESEKISSGIRGRGHGWGRRGGGVIDSSQGYARFVNATIAIKPSDDYPAEMVAIFLVPKFLCKM